MIYYGQQGEDSVLWSIFKKTRKNGFFIDVGALDGMRFSNTYSFEQAGWKGLCIEAHPDYIQYLKKNRPNSKIVHAAVSDTNKDSVDFFSTKIGAFSTLDGTMCNYFGSIWKAAKKYDKIKVPMRTLNSILEEMQVKTIDVISIDIEGTELAAIRGLDLEKYKPRVLVVEALDEERRVNLVNYMKEFGYLCPRRKANNYFFCRTVRDAERLRTSTLVDGKVLRTDHPLRYKNQK
jgi:FkbM family methyltransferase